MTVKIKLKEVRESKGLSQNRLAQACDMTLQNIQKIEYGKAKSLTLDALDKLCSALQCQPGDLLKYEAEHPAVEQEQEHEQPIAPSRRRKAATAPAKEKQEFKPGQMVKNPAGWRGWINKLLEDGRAVVDWENQVNGDVIPLHLLSAAD